MGVPEKIDIPDRYVPDSEDELTQEEKIFHEEKAQKLKKLLAAQRFVLSATLSPAQCEGVVKTPSNIGNVFRQKNPPSQRLVGLFVCPCA